MVPCLRREGHREHELSSVAFLTAMTCRACSSVRPHWSDFARTSGACAGRHRNAPLRYSCIFSHHQRSGHATASKDRSARAVRQRRPRAWAPSRPNDRAVGLRAWPRAGRSLLAPSRSWLPRRRKNNGSSSTDVGRGGGIRCWCRGRCRRRSSCYSVGPAKLCHSRHTLVFL